MPKLDDIDTSGIDPEILNNPLFRRVAQDALDKQDRFSAEPVYARTGKGYLKSVGVEEIARVKEEMARRKGEDTDEDHDE